MKSVEHDQEDADTWWETENPLFRECVWLELSILKRSD
jgi:hypothetical protein